MSRRAAALVVAAAALVLALALLMLWRQRSPRFDAGDPSAGPAPLEPSRPAPAPAAVEVALRPVVLWLPGPNGRIAPLSADIADAATAAERIETLMTALLATKPEPPLAPLFPKPVGLGAALATADGTLYVDLVPADGGAPPPAGSTLELQRIYSIVHTALHNEPSIARVVLLWSGVQRPSLAGHVDTGRPLTLRLELEAP